MKRISEFLTKPVISLYDSKTEGIIKTIYFDRNLKKMKWLVLFDNDEHAEDCALKTSDIFNVGENAIIIRNDGCLNLEFSTISANDKQSPINNSVYTTKGKFMGTVVDVEVDEKFNTQNIVLNNGNVIEIKKVASSGSDALILQDNEKQIKVSNYKKKFPKIQLTKTTVVKIMEQQVEPVVEDLSPLNEIEQTLNINEPLQIKAETKNISTTQNAIESGETKENEKNLQITKKTKPVKKYVLDEKNAVPNRISTNFDFLIGRTIEKNIFSVSKVLLAKKGTKINQKIINLVKEHYKLRELIQFSK